MIFDIEKEFNGIISVIGASEIDKETEEITFEIGRLLAQNKFIVACGGLSGVMEAVCRGAKKENGEADKTNSTPPGKNLQIYPRRQLYFCGLCRRRHRP